MESGPIRRSAGILVHPDRGEEFARRVREVDPETLWEDAAPLGVDGRGGLRRIDLLGEEYLLKRERRGGFVSKLVPDGFLRRGPFLMEWALSLELSREGLTPPMAARWFLRRGPLVAVYTLLEPLARSASVAALWRGGGLTAAIIRAAGACVGSLHARGILHGDLNAGNLLLAPSGKVLAIDWRRSLERHPLPERLRRSNLLRLARSLHKVRHRHGLPWPQDVWRHLAEGYASGFGSREAWLDSFPSAASRGFSWRKVLWPSPPRKR